MSRGQKYRNHRALLVVTCVLALALLTRVLLVHWSVNGAQRTTAQGAIRDTRVVPYSALQTKAGSQLNWVAEYQVVYSVGGREYSVWADSDIRGESKAEVQLRLPQFLPSCRVWYSLKDPKSAVARCP
jgi:hypothetical protein